MTIRQKNLNLVVLRVLQFLFIFLLVFEAITAVRLGLINLKILLNENLRSTPAQEIYVETYNSLLSKKVELKQQNPVAALPIGGRITLYCMTFFCLLLTTKIRNKIRRMRKRKVYNAIQPVPYIAPVTPIVPAPPRAPVAPVAPTKRKWVDIAKYYNYPI